MQLKAILLSAVVALVMLSPTIEAYSSGKHNSSGGCGCHGSSSSVTITDNFPSSYTPGQTYSIQVSVSGGISGTKGGFNVEVDKGSLSTGGNSGVKVSGKSVTHSNKANRAWSFDWTGPSAGSGTVSVGIAGMTANGASGTNGDAWSTKTLAITETVVSTNNPPTVSNIQITPLVANSADDLTATYIFNDQDAGDTESGTLIHWYKNGVHTTQHDGLTTLAKAHTTRNDDWQVLVTPSDGEDFGATDSSNIITVANSPPSISSVLLSPLTPTTEDNITSTIAGQNDEDGDALSFEYRWYLDGNLQEGLNNLSQLPSLATRNDDIWMLEIRAYDGEDYSNWAGSNSITIGQHTSNTAPTVDSITITPTNPDTQDHLVAQVTSSDADLDSITATEYQWRKNGAIAGITSSTVDSSTTSKGEVWSVEARVNDGTVWSAWTTSSPQKILNSVPVLESATISAVEVQTDENVTLTATMSDVDGDALTMNIMWYLDGTLQPDYTNEAILPSTLTSKGTVWTAVIQAYDGTDLSLESQTLSVEIVNSPPEVSVALEQVTSEDELTIGTEIADVDGDDVEIVSVTWFRNGFREGSLDDATTVPATFLGPGQEWSVELVSTDGEATVLSSASVTIANAPPIAEISILTESLFAGERVHLSAVQSSDPDNSIVRYQWTWQGGASSGIQTSLLLPQTGTIEVSLLVTDVAGATNTTTVGLSTIPALPCPILSSSVSGNNVNLVWTWTSPESTSFEIKRNGVTLGITNTTSFSDTPTLSGLSSYQIQTFIGDRALESPCQNPSVDATIEVSLVDVEDGPSALGGLGLGSIYALLGIFLLVSAFLRRGE